MWTSQLSFRKRPESSRPLPSCPTLIHTLPIVQTHDMTKKTGFCTISGALDYDFQV